MSSTDTNRGVSRIYRRFVANDFGRIVAVEERSIPFPVMCYQHCDFSLHYIDEHGNRCDKTELTLDSLPWVVGGVVEIDVNSQVVFAAVPAGTYICEGHAPVAQLECIEDFGYSADLPGDYELTFDAPRHLIKKIIVRVRAAGEALA